MPIKDILSLEPDLLQFVSIVDSRVPRKIRHTAYPDSRIPLFPDPHGEVIQALLWNHRAICSRKQHVGIGAASRMILQADDIPDDTPL